MFEFDLNEVAKATGTIVTDSIIVPIIVVLFATSLALHLIKKINRVFGDGEPEKWTPPERPAPKIEIADRIGYRVWKK